jgi:anti-sigma factor RsiW
MDCDKATELISAYIDGGLGPRDRVFVAEHFLSCADCREEHVRFERAKALLAENPAYKMPVNLRKRIESSIGLGTGETAGENSGWAAWLGPRWAAAGALAAVAVMWGWPFHSPPAPRRAVSVKTLLAEHVRVSRKSADVQRATLASAPYDFIGEVQDFE